ncbi:MAG: ABC transporter ATP-binding protein [Pseudanabaenaceae cyanobacterium bins.68]|nr:ABC transporter ATP-binding protein [Pseudanabaenaceae cyanobacterium bins.68]
MLPELAVRTENLTKRFERYLAVNQVDLAIAPGEVYGLIGPNGAGKTTLIRMLAMAEEPSLGEIYLNGDRLEPGKHNPILKRRLGYLPDDYPLYDDLTVWDYLDYFARLYQLQGARRTQRLHEVLELVSLEHKRQSQIATLSRGMKQRLSLARTIIHQPILLLLDEPVSGLDPIARLEFRDIIKSVQAAGMTVLISSHILSDLAEMCTAIGIMELGCLVESAPLQDLYQKLSQQQIWLSSLGDSKALVQFLTNYAQVEKLELLPQGLRIDFSGDPEDAANLLKALIEQGFRITEFHQTREDLETIFLKLGHRQAN